MIVDITNVLRSDGVCELLAQCHYQPTKERVAALADLYASDETIGVLGWYEGERLEGLIVLKRMDDHSSEIKSIAVDEPARGRGIGSELIKHAKAQRGCEYLCAETDDDAVGFYQKLGFFVVSLGEKYEGITRYLCTL